MINFFNRDDYALGWWETVQDTKPDAGYLYDDVNLPHTFRGPGWTTLSFPTDRYEIFAFAAEARSRAVGAQPNVGGSTHGSEQVDLGDVPHLFGDAPTGHSAQFYSSSAVRHAYWQEVLRKSGL